MTHVDFVPPFCAESGAPKRHHVDFVLSIAAAKRAPN
jgi:hypothetical protein